MREYTVYLHISPSGKRYYGITTRDVNKRWKNGKGYIDNKHFYRAIEKYGWKNFQHIIVAKGLDEETSKWLEIELIREFNTTDRNKGYNITLGGEGGNGWIPSENTRNKMIENNARYWKGKHRSKEDRKKMSEARKGKKPSEETKMKMSKAKKKSVICITTGRIFYSAKEGAEYYNCNQSHISSCCKGERKSVGKYKGEKLVWRYLVWNHKENYRIVTNK